jgi:hypothetical protein
MREELQTIVCEGWHEARLLSRFIEKSREHPCPQLSTNVTNEDAASFLLGMRLDPPLYEIRHGNHFFTSLLPLRADGSPRHELLFEADAAGKVWLRDETIAHYGAATEMVTEWEWPDR